MSSEPSLSFLDLSVCIPSYCEEENLRILIPRLRETLDELGCTYEILIIDSEKPLDGTEDVCSTHDVAYLRRTGGNTFGCAVRHAIRSARGHYMVFMDADGSHTPEFIPELYEKREQADVVIASRYVEGGYTENPVALVLMSKLLNFTYSLVLNLDCKDVSNSFKLYRADYLKELSLKCENFDIVEEILVKMKRLHPSLSMHEIPFSFKKRMFGQTKRSLVSFIFTYLVTMMRLRFSK